MHELPVTKSILNTVIETAEVHGGYRVLAIDLVIGDLSSIVDDSVQFYFDILSENTLAEGAMLRFRREAASVVCVDCLNQFQMTPPLPSVCPQCGSVKLRVSGGQEFYIESIEVADEDPCYQKNIERERASG